MRTIVILSGGMDSAVLLAQLKSEGRECKCLSIDYGQRHKRELVMAQYISNHYQVEHKVINLSGLRAVLGGSSQTDQNVTVPQGHYADENMKLTVVPNRNMILLSIAGAWAISLKYDTVAYGAHAGDHAIYPDCREEFVQILSKALELADWHRITLERPFINKSKGEIVAQGAVLDVPFDRTYSCYKGGLDHCGQCGTCVERRMAFIEAGVKDPTTYQNPLKPEYEKEAMEKRVGGRITCSQ
jgi:7-cyano-7-deazaguanine synthase